MWQFIRTLRLEQEWGFWFAIVLLEKEGDQRQCPIKFDKTQPTLADADIAGVRLAMQWTLKESPTVDIDSMTREDFFGRFTPAEIATIYQLAAVNAEVFAYVKLAEINPTVNRRYQPVIDGLRKIEAAGVLAAGRANEILGIE